ncbi:MAG TPA: hypothetical protein VHE83_07530, partial [Mycobacteriales bacterium]|nr:hypothetical protein [Mycobacteriales bacterium]
SARPTPAVPVVGTPRTVAPVPVAAATPAPEASADRAPVRTFATIGAPGAPWGIVTAHDGTVYVGTDNGTANGGTTPSVVMAFRADGTLARTYAVAGQPDGHADGLTGLALDGTGGLVALDEPTSRVLRLDLETGTQSTLATVPDVPPCTPLASSACEPGPLDHAPVLRAVAPDGRGGLLVTDAGQATVWRVPVAGGPAQVWYQSADLAIGDGPAGLTVAGGRVLLTVGTTVDPNALVAPALYALAIGADGTAGARTLVTAFARGEAPQGVVAAASGRIYVALQGADAVAVVGPDGVVQQRLSGEFDAPAGLALRKGSLLVANTSRTGKWTVVDVAVPESGS